MQPTSCSTVGRLHPPSRVSTHPGPKKSGKPQQIQQVHTALLRQSIHWLLPVCKLLRIQRLRESPTIRRQKNFHHLPVSSPFPSGGSFPESPERPQMPRVSGNLGLPSRNACVFLLTFSSTGFFFASRTIEGLCMEVRDKRFMQALIW